MTRNGGAMPQGPATAAVEPLDVLVGQWTLEGENPLDASHPVRGTARFEWLEGGHFLLQRWHIEPPPFPSGIAVIGADGPDGALAQHYYDSRGVKRTYGVAVADGVVTIERPKVGDDFAQR